MGGEEGLGVTTGQPNLYKQDLSKLDVTKLTALSREVISRQATINIGTIGHVAHGKSTIVKAISGVQTVRFKNELERNITIKLDARAEENGNGERVDIEEDQGEMPPNFKKRSLSPITAQRSAKHRKFDMHDNPHRACYTEDNCQPREESDNVSSRDDRLIDTHHVSFISNGEDLLVLTGPSAMNGDCLEENDCLDSNSLMDEEMFQDEPPMKDIALKEVKVVLEDVGALIKSGLVKMNNLTSCNEDWEVEKLLRRRSFNGKIMYLVKWKDWGPEYNSWEPLKNLGNCQELLMEFKNERERLLEEFKDKIKFYPTTRNIEEFMKRFSLKLKNVDQEEIDEDNFYKSVRNFLKQKSSRKSKEERSLKNWLLRVMLNNTRQDQLKLLKEWEEEMNSITKGKPEIRVENFVDFESAPDDFFYIDEYLPGLGITIPDDPPIGCECASCHLKSEQCCYSQCSRSIPYTSANRVKVPPGTPIYECNKRCKCGLNCLNRVVQRGTNAKLCIFRTFNGRGWGVKTLRAVKKGTFITEYVGEVITYEEAEKRGKVYDAAGRTYLFDLDYNESEGECPYTVDAATYGNVSHFINHSCEPNLAVYAVWINCLDPNLPKLGLFATRDIKQNEEITFDYMCQTARNNDRGTQRSFAQDEPSLQTTVDAVDQSTATPLDFTQRLETPESDLVSNKTLCKCGAINCRKYLF